MSEPTGFDNDPDPTGVRILLAAEPDPGPMPADVSARILAAFAEAGRRADLDADAGSRELSAELGLELEGPDSDLDFVGGQGFSDHPRKSTGPAGLHLVGRAQRSGDTSAELPEQRPSSASPGRAAEHRRRLTILGGAAASVAALGLVGALLNHQATGGATSGVRAESLAGAAKTAGGAAPAAADSQLAATPNLRNASGQAMHIELSTRTYSKATLARQAQDMLDAPGAELGQPAVESPAVGPIGTLVGLTDCVTTLGEDNAEAVYADLATFDGSPAVVIVVVNTGLKQAFAVSRNCSKGDPGLIFGPVDMP
jgi:hypothetical protein